MAEVILFKPKTPSNATRYPLGLLHIATPLVNRGYTVKIIDMDTCEDWNADLRQAIDTSTICAGVGVMTGGSIRWALEFAAILKSLKPIPVVFGGIHPSFLPAQTLENKFVDIVAIGEGERKLLSIVECIKKNEALNNIKGIAFKKNGAVLFTEPEKEFLDLNYSPMPDFTLIDTEYYIRNSEKFLFDKKRVIDLNVDRGCPYRCGFCYNINFNKCKWRAISAQKILGMVEKYIREYDITAFNFVSDNFFVDKNRVYDFCKGIVDKGIEIAWHADMRVDAFLRYENDLVELIKKSGCNILTFGIESGSNRILKQINKGITVNDVLMAHKKLQSFDFKVNYHFMLGFPEETTSDIKETIRLIETLTLYKNANIFGPAVYVPYPGTPLFERCCELGFKQPDSLEEWITCDWAEMPRLPWFSKYFKNYIMEIQTICRGAFQRVRGKNILRKFVNIYCRCRVFGLKFGIRFFDIDTRLIRFFKQKLSF